MRVPGIQIEGSGRELELDLGAGLLTPVSPLPGIVPSTALSTIVIGHFLNSLPAIGQTDEEDEGFIDGERYRGKFRDVSSESGTTAVCWTVS